TVNEYFDGESVIYAKSFPFKVILEHFISSEWPYFRPLVLLQWKIETHFFGKNYRYFHYSLMVLNLMNIILILLLGFELFKSKVTSFLTGLIFTLHPTHGEVVFLLWSRFDVLVGIFYMLALILFIKCQNILEKADDRGFADKRANYNKLLIISLITFIFALGSKEMAATLPLIIFIYVFINKVHLGLGKSLWIAARRSSHHFIILSIYIVFLFFRGGSFKYVSSITSQFSLFASNIYSHLVQLIVPGFFLFFMIVGLFARERIYYFTFIFTFTSLLPLIHLSSEQRFEFVPTIGYSLSIAWLLTRGIERLFIQFFKFEFFKRKSAQLKLAQYLFTSLVIISFACFLWSKSYSNLHYWHHVQYERNYLPSIIKTCPTLPEGVILYLCDDGYQKDAPKDDFMLFLSGYLFFQYGERTRALSLMRYFYPKTSKVFEDLDKSCFLEYKNGMFIRRDDLSERVKTLSEKFGSFQYETNDLELKIEDATKSVEDNVTKYNFNSLNVPSYRYGRIEVEFETTGQVKDPPKVLLEFSNGQSNFTYEMLKKDQDSASYHIDLYTNINWILKGEIENLQVIIENRGEGDLRSFTLKVPPPIFYDMLKLGFPWLH
ncbi:hypothetical protein KKB18_04850, partial [bacterium]|nr:hypothetical protein [bacterium]